MAVTGQVDKAYISSLSFIDDFEFMSDVLDVTSEERSILDILEMTGGVEEVTGEPTYHHWENDYVFALGKVAGAPTDGTAVPANGCNVAVATAEEMPVEGELVWFSETRNIARVYQIGVDANGGASALRFTLAPVYFLSGTDLFATTLDTHTMSYFSGAYGEGTGSPEGRKPKFNISKNNIQIFKSSGKVTDLQKVSKLRVSVNGQNYIMYKLQNEVLFAHRAKIAYAFLMGSKSSGLDKDGNTVYTTQGLDQYILNGDGEGGSSEIEAGITLDLASSAVVKADIRSFSRQLDKRGAPAEYWLWAGGEFRADWDDLWTAQTTNGAVQYNSFGKGDGKNKALDLGVNSLYAYGRTWHVKTINAFDQDPVFGGGAESKPTALPANCDKDAFAIPTGMIKVDQSGKMSPRMKMRYMSGDGTDFRHMETLTGKLAPTPTNDDAYLKISYQTIAGFEACGVRQFGKFIG